MNRNFNFQSHQVFAFLVLMSFGGAAMSYEEPNYTTVYEKDGVEYRQYDSYLVSETVIKNARNSDAAGSEGFKRLFRYITGANTMGSKVSMTAPVMQGSSEPAKSEKIAMTVPVQQSESADGWRVSFMLPSEYTLQTAPQPTDSRVYVREVPARLVAVRQFSGRWTESNFNEQSARLENQVSDSNLNALGEVERAAYNSPFSLPFMRRNEVMLAVDRLPAMADEAGSSTVKLAAF